MPDFVVTERANLVAVANALRNKTGQTNQMTLGQMISSTNDFKTDPVLQDKTVTPSASQQMITADSGYDGLDTVTVNAMPTATQATPSISVSSSGLITANTTQSAGYVPAGTKSATKQLATQAAKTVTPTTSEQTAVASGIYTTGAVKVKGDANLKAENIKSGVSIFGVSGSYEGSGGTGVEVINKTIGFNLELVEEMYEPGANLYILRPTSDVDLANYLTLFVNIYFYRLQGYEADLHRLYFAKYSTYDDFDQYVRDSSASSYMPGGFFINTDEYSEYYNTIEFVGTISSYYRIDIIGNGIYLQ